MDYKSWHEPLKGTQSHSYKISFRIGMSEGPGIKRGISPHNFIKELYHTKPHSYYLGIQNPKMILPNLHKIPFVRLNVGPSLKAPEFEILNVQSSTYQTGNFSI